MARRARAGLGSRYFLCRVITPPRSSRSGSDIGKSTKRSRRRACRRAGAKALRARYVPLSQRRRAARGAPRRADGHRHHLPLSADARQVRDAPDGLGRLRSARRTARHQDRHPPADHHRKEHRQFPAAGENARFQLRLGPRAEHDRRRISALDAMDFSAAVRHLVRRRAAKGPADRRAADSRATCKPQAKKRCAATRTSTGWPISSKRR